MKAEAQSDTRLTGRWLAAGRTVWIVFARKSNADPSGMHVLVPALESAGYVQEQNGAYANTAMTSKWLLRRGAGFSAGFEFWGFNLFQLMNNLEDSLRTGKPPLNLYEWIETQPDASRAFQEWMVAIAGFAGDEIIRNVPLPGGARRLLDIGGGHARYAIAFCRRYPNLAATVFDSPRALKSAEASLAETGMNGRVTLQPGNFLADDLAAYRGSGCGKNTAGCRRLSLQPDSSSEKRGLCARRSPAQITGCQIEAMKKSLV